MHDIPQETDLESRQPPRLRCAAVMTAGILALGVALAACGGGSSTPGVATVSTTTTIVSTSGGGSTKATGLLAYSSCMRSHGVVNFPDPTANGGIPKEGVISAGRAVSDSLMQTAEHACKHLLPSGGSLSGKATHPIPAQDQQDYLKAVACLRSHGITNFPDPVFSGGQVEFPQLEHLVDLNSPQFKHAQQICQKLIPAGLPDSGSGG